MPTGGRAVLEREGRSVPERREEVGASVRFTTGKAMWGLMRKGAGL